MGSQPFNFQQGWQTFNVPNKVTRLTFTVNGAGSGTTPGGKVTGSRDVNPNQTIKILVGEAGNGGNGKNGGATAQGGGGAGGDANGGGCNGGNGGGGATIIRLNDTQGVVIAVAAGAGGKSGDNGDPGRGGAATGESGGHGNDGGNSTTNATGGTQSQPGNRGTSSSGSSFNGHDADGGVGGRGGRGGDPGNNYGHGGGGGGGGYRSGGGGQASSKGYAPGGGGGGGSNYVGGMPGGQSTRGGGGTGNGSVTITWTNPPPDPAPEGNNPPLPPSNVKIADTNQNANVVTLSTGKVKVTADLRDPDGDDVTMNVLYSRNNWKTNGGEYARDQDGHIKWYSTPKTGLVTATVILEGLQQDSRYELRIYSHDRKGKQNGPTGGSFWTNRQPQQPELTSPGDNVSFLATLPTTFGWNFKDPDEPKDNQSGFELKWRTVTSGGKVGEWKDPPISGGAANSWVSSTDTFKGNQFYEWTVRTKDDQGRWGPWQENFRSFHTEGTSSPPILLEPIHDRGRDATNPILFDWQFVDQTRSDNQVKADFRWRVMGADVPLGLPGPDWHTVFGDTTTPGTATRWVFPANTFPINPGEGYRIEWQVRTYDSAIAPASEWSESESFFTMGTPGASAPDTPLPDPLHVQGALGCGTYRVYLYDRGGGLLRGEVTPISRLTFGRLRDDISSCTITTIGFGTDCGEVLKDIRSWMHELVVFRDGERVWEGPITRITYAQDSVEFEAKDVMAYLYRRIMRQGYNDRFYYDPNAQPDEQQVAGLSVVIRAYLILVDALARFDPNVLPYLTAFTYDDDAKQTRAVPDFSQTAFQQVDDLAANAGLDYTVVGRRIILWDTHRPIGRLPEMRDGDFSDPPVVTEYGMQTCNFSAVTNNTGKWAAVTPIDPNTGEKLEAPNKFYGPVEMLASSYSETGNEDKMREQARRNIGDRWPTPIVVRVPDNSTLNPDVNLGFQQLIPGVWIPLRSQGTLRTVEQWQKLDSVTVTFENGLEQVQVVMSPAPNSGVEFISNEGGE